MSDSLLPVRYISTAIARMPQDVYDFASEPGNLPSWAAGLGSSITEVDGAWIAESGMGRLKLEFAAHNPFGILDHTVTLPTGESFYNPVRVFANGTGSEIVFALFRLPGVTDDDFERDAAAVAGDLATLKALLER
jgi:hypothetical protein